MVRFFKTGPKETSSKTCVIRNPSDNVFIMKNFFGIILVGFAVLLSSSGSFGSISAEEAIKKRIEMFKLSKENIKKLRTLIRSGEVGDLNHLVEFHVRWSEEMHLLFPPESQASISNGSDASSDIWKHNVRFENSIGQYKLNSIKLKKAAQSGNVESINKSFEGLVGACKGCHKQFRN